MSNTDRSSATMMRDLMATRHSCRAFLPDPIPLEVVREILTAAQRTPSWCNSQPWQTIVTSASETDAFRGHLAARIPEVPGRYDIKRPERYDGVYRDRRRRSGFALYDSLGIARHDADARARQAMRNFEFFDAPHVAVITSAADLGPYGYVDCGGYVSMLLLAAHAHGVASIAQAAIAGFSNVVREFFELPANRHVVCAVSLGYPDADAPANGFRTERADLSDVVQLRGFADAP